MCGVVGEDHLELDARFVVASFPGQDGAQQDARIAVASGYPLEEHDGLAALAGQRQLARSRQNTLLSVEPGRGAHHHRQHCPESPVSEGHCVEYDATVPNGAVLMSTASGHKSA